MRPMLVSRIGQVVLWLVLGGLGVGALLNLLGGHPLVLVASGLVVAAGVVLAVRSYRMGVRYGPDGIEVRGLLMSRRIATEQITQITNFPAVRWQSAAGKARWTPIFALSGIGQLAAIHRYNQFCILRLQTWDDERRLKARRNPAKTKSRRPRR